MSFSPLRANRYNLASFHGSGRMSKLERAAPFGPKLRAARLLLFAGCASGPIGTLAAPEPTQASGEVLVVRNRNFFGAGTSYYLVLDGQEFFGIRIGQNTRFRISAGRHQIGVKCFGGWTSTWHEDSHVFDMLADGRAYFIVSPSPACADIKRVDQNEGERAISRSRYVAMPQ